MGKIVITDEGSTPGTPADGVTVYSALSVLKYVDESGAVHEVVTDQNIDVATADIQDGAITNGKLATDVKIGSLASLTTTETASVIGAINELDAENPVNLMWDPTFQHVEDFSYWLAKSWWQGSASTLAIRADSTNPWGSRKSLRVTSSQKGKGAYLDAIGLAPGDVISVAMQCTAASGTYRARVYFRTTGPGASTAGSVSQSGDHTFSGDTVVLKVENITIPATANWIEVVPYSASFGTIDIYAMWMHRATTVPDYPTPSPITATYLREKEWETSRVRLMVRNIDSTNFAVYQPLPDGETWLAWLFTQLATNNWTYYGANMCSDNAGTGAYAALTFDIGYSIYYTPDGATGETCGNHHLYDDFTAVNFYDESGDTVDPTASGAAFTVAKLRIEQKGTLRHPDTSTTDHATISRFIELTLDGVYEHQRLSWLTSNNSIGYWNTGQLLAASATRAWVHNAGDAPFTTSDTSQTVEGQTRAYTWYSARKFAFQVECPTVEAIQMRQTTLKLYPRTINTDVTRDAGDVDHAEWYWRVIYDKEFAKRI